MSSQQQKTIVINPELFSGSSKKKTGENNNTTRKKERKIKPIVPPTTPNSKTLRKQFIKKIKEKQAENEREYKLLEKQKEEVKSIKSNEPSLINNSFQDEFTKSLAYLTALTENREKEKRKKREEEKINKKNFTLKRERNISPEIQLDLPDTLIPHKVEITPIVSNFNPISFQTNNNKPASYINKETNINLQNINSNNYFQKPFEVQYPHIIKDNISANTNNFNNFINNENENDNENNSFINIELKKPPPYGCLKGGNKPTYKEWNKNNQTLKITNERNNIKGKIKIEDFKPNDELSEREKRLQILKNKYSIHKNENLDKKVQTKKHKYTRTIKKTTTIRNFKLGKNSKRKSISVLIKNGATRKRVKTEVSQLKQKGLSEIKEYLRARNLLKVGSEAPPDVLRQMYETSILTGEINNLSSETLVHNFLNA